MIAVMTKEPLKKNKKTKGFWIVLGDDKHSLLGAGKTPREAFLQAVKKVDLSPITKHEQNILTLSLFWRQE